MRSKTRELPDSPPVPASLARLFAGWRWTLVWQIVPFQLVYRVDHDLESSLFIKLAFSDNGDYYQGEVDRTLWLGQYLPAPAVVDHGWDGKVAWMITNAIDGLDGTELSYANKPDVLVKLLARGLRQIHSLDVDTCPFDFRISAAIAKVKNRMKRRLIDPLSDFHDEHSDMTVPEAVRLLEQLRPPAEDLVVCHGDYCVPNILLKDDDVVGFVDLGELGIADRWWDLAVAAWSLDWNLGPGFEDQFLTEYGVERDERKIRFYRLLYDLVS